MIQNACSKSLAMGDLGEGTLYTAVRRAGIRSAKFGKGLMRRRHFWDERQGDLFGAPSPKPAAANRPSSAKRNLPEDPPAEAVSLAFSAKHSSRHEIEDMVNELDDDELARLIVKGVRTLKGRLNRAGKGGSRPGWKGGRRSPLEKTLQDIAAELSDPDEHDADW